MSKKRDAIKTIFKISQSVLSLTDEEFEELQEMADKQKAYCNPLKPVTTAEQYELGEHNQKVIDILKQFKKILIEGKPEE